MNKNTSLDDIAESIADLSTMTADLLAQSEQRLTDMVVSSEQRLTGMITDSEQRLVGMITDSEQRLTTMITDSEQRLIVRMDTGFDKLSRQLEGHEEDIKTLYLMLDDLRKDSKTFTRHERRRFDDLETFALQVAEKTGIPYQPGSKPKRLS